MLLSEKTLRRLMLTSLLIVACVLSASATCFAQQTADLTVAPSLTNASQQDSDILKLLEKTKLELDAEKQKNALMQDRLDAKDVTIKSLQGLVDVKDQQLALAKDALAARTQVNTGDARLLVEYQNQLAKADARIAKLEHPGFLRSVFDYRSMSGAIVGFGTCKAFGH